MHSYYRQGSVYIPITFEAEGSNSWEEQPTNMRQASWAAFASLQEGADRGNIKLADGTEVRLLDDPHAFFRQDAGASSTLIDSCKSSYGTWHHNAIFKGEINISWGK